MARASHLCRRDGGRYYLQIRLKSFSPRLPSRLIRLSLETSDYALARQRLAERMTWLYPLQMTHTPDRRYQEIRNQLEAQNARGPVMDRSRLAQRITFEHVVRGLIDELGGLREDGPFNEAWMTFCRENLAAETRIATQDRLSAYEQGRIDALTAAGLAPPVRLASPSLAPGFDPTRPGNGVVLIGQGNGRDTAASDLDVILARQAAANADAFPPSPHKPDAPGNPTLQGTADDQAQPPDAAQVPCERSDDTKVLSDFFEEFLAGRKEHHGDDRARSQIGPIVGFTIALLGDKHPREYTRADFSRLNAAIPAIPTTKGIPAKLGRSLIARYQYAQSHPKAQLVAATEGTIKKNYHSGLNRFFGWLRKQGLMTQEPVLDLVKATNRVSLPRDSFEDEEILQFLKEPLFTGCHSRERCWTPGPYLFQGSLYWQYLILLLTGMRPGEVGSLEIANLVEGDGFFWFDLRPFDARRGRVTLAEVKALKTMSSARIVPIHPLLVELGLIDHRDAMLKAGQKRLLPDCKPYIKPDGQIRWSQEITKSWAYVKEKYPYLARKDISLYSTRHTMAQIIDELVLPSRTRDRVLGHAHGSSLAGNYGRNGALSAEELKQFTGITNPLIEAMRDILLPPKLAADGGQLTLLRSLAPAKP